MLLTLLYHRIGNGKYANSLHMIKKHLQYLKKHNVVLPGDPLSFWKWNVCITFDDGYFDFYHYVYPLLKKYHLKAVLAIPTKEILDRCDMDAKERLSLKEQPEAFCTWEEIKEMENSGFVQIASHAHSHQNLLLENIDWKEEILLSKQILEKKLQNPISTFVYPLGKFNNKIHAFVKDHYTHAMRIGSALNISWHNPSGIIYRIQNDQMKNFDHFLQTKQIISYIWFYVLNTLRKR